MGDLSQKMLMPEDFKASSSSSTEQGAEIFAEFSGRELMLSSLREKCSHLAVKDAITDSYRPIGNLFAEESLFESFVERTKRCE